jgi:hypothetical protein
MSIRFGASGEHNGAARARQLLESEAVTDVAVEEGTFRIGSEQVLIMRWWDLEIEVALAVAELEFQVTKGWIVLSPSQGTRIQRHTLQRGCSL